MSPNSLSWGPSVRLSVGKWQIWLPAIFPSPPADLFGDLMQIARPLGGVAIAGQHACGGVSQLVGDLAVRYAAMDAIAGVQVTPRCSPGTASPGIRER